MASSRCLILLVLLHSISGCSSISYYAQSMAGQFEILRKQQSIRTILQNNHLSENDRRQLRAALTIRRFASESLGLPDNDSYRDYVDLGRDYVVWNIFAAPELSLQPREWCYMLVGCLHYRGYFNREKALTLASELERQGMDVYTGGVTAYSTLGWFDDPVLNTMLRGSTTQLANVIFHELAHQQLFIRNDTRFNEAFADTVAGIGVQRWLKQHGSPQERDNHATEQQEERAFLKLVFEYREKLRALYQSGLPDSRKRTEKQRLLSGLRSDYRQSVADRPGRYDAWVSGVNNAALLAVITYHDFLPGFFALLKKTRHNLPAFYQLVEQLTHCPKHERHRILEQQETEFRC